MDRAAMMKKYHEDFNKADKKFHPVEKQWHFKHFTAHGFTCADEPQQGFVRSYNYTNGQGITIQWTTGVNSDYWSVLEGEPKGGGYHAALLPYLEQLEEELSV